MDAELKQYVERVLQLARDSFHTYGRDTNIPNVDSTQKDVGYRLQKAILEFSKLYGDSKKGEIELRHAAGQVEGYLRTGQTIAALSDKEAEQLIDDLYNLVEKRGTRGIYYY